MRRTLIQMVLPLFFCLIPLLAAALVIVCVPPKAMDFFLNNMGPMDRLILGLGVLIFSLQMILCWRALRWRGAGFDADADRWVSNLAQAAEWFPLLGLLGTVGGILQTFSSVTGTVQPHEIIRNYAPAITATGAGLFMAFINILPSWMVILGRDLIVTLGGSRPAPAEDEP